MSLFIQKTQPIRSHAWTYGAKDQPCIRCDSHNRVCFCHYEGPRQLAYGKAAGQKGHDIIGADLCEECDKHFTKTKSAELDEKTWIQSEEFLHYSMLTLIRRYRQDILKL